MVAVPRPHHCRPNDPDPYTPSDEWPGRTPVQWGSHGMVFARHRGGEDYKTAFFEAFPDDDSAGFIRGEGQTVAEAEENALQKWRQYAGCQHRWGRKGRNDGFAVCRKCGASRKALKPAWVGQRDLSASLTPPELTLLSMGYLRRSAAFYATSADDVTAERADQKALEIRCRRHGIEPPSIHLDEDTYRQKMAREVARYYAANREWYMSRAAEESGVGALFTPLEIHRLDAMAEEHGFLPPEEEDEPTSHPTT